MDMTSVNSNIIVENEEEKSISVQNKDIMVVNSEPEFEVTVQRKEYSVVGDELYIPKRYEDAPQWLRDLIGTVTEESFNQKITELNSLTQTLNQLIVELDVAKNTYTQSIISSNDIDERINTAITTLNSSLAQSDATILGIANTKVTPQESLALTIDTLSASIENGAINALVSNIENASVDRDSALANDISLVHSELSGDIEGNADAITSLNTSVTNINNTLTAQATEITNLTTELDNGINTWAIADSTLENSLMTEISDESSRVESKFAYNSNILVNGVPYSSGFGIATNVNSPGQGIDDGDSEFWINAEKFKFTNTNRTGAAAPFTIDASGSQPQITFNGKVTFGSGQVGTIDQAIAAVVETVAVGDKNINITDNLIPTTSLVADTDNSGYQFIGTPTKSMSAGLESFSEPQIVLDTGDEVYSPYVDEVAIPYYYRFGIKGITNLNRFKIVTINSSNIVSYNNVTVTMEAGQTLIANNWYTVDGIINPIGGNTTADGDIRDINGVKVGSINNFVMPSGTTKVLLGWIANCTISRMKLCNITADTITSDYSSVNGQLSDLRNQIDNIDVNWNNLTGKDVFAQKLGYPTYAALEEAASAGKTVVVGGYVNTNLIQVGAIKANQINTTGLIAENISAEEIFGKTLSGTVINGARINGSVIKTSYLDLDGELEVLTNYHISVATRNANPSLYTDAVYISADNEYRIPSMSDLKSLLKEIGNIYGPYLIGDYTLASEIYSYASANIGTNRKAVKARPKINIGISPASHIPENHLYSSFFDTINSGSGYFRFYVGNLLILSVVKSGSSVSYSGLAGSGSIASPAYNQFNTVNLSYGGMALSVKRLTFYGDRLYVTYGGATTLQITDDWSSGQIRVEAGNPSQSLVGLRLPEITINNFN